MLVVDDEGKGQGRIPATVVLDAVSAADYSTISNRRNNLDGGCVGCNGGLCVAGAPKYWTLQGASPSGYGQQEFRIPNSFVEHVQRYGPEHKFHELKLVKEILELPTVIFEGLREEQEEGLCYAGVPSCSYSNQGRKKPPLEGKTFLVFLTDANVFQWRWEEADPDMAGYPLKWRERFGSQKWPPT